MKRNSQVDDAVSEVYPITAGVPKETVPGSVLYFIYTTDLPVSEEILVTTFAADDTTIVLVNKYHTKNAVHRLCTWFEKWRIKTNEDISRRMTIVNRFIPS